MKLIIVTLFLASTLADKLQNNYLPPLSARNAGGSHEFLSAPSKTADAYNRFRPAPATSAGSSSQFGRSNLNSFATPTASFRTHESFSGPPIPILRSSSDNNGDGSYRFAYETENRIVQEEEGHLENVGTDNEANTVRGSYSFQAPDGQVFTVNYIADENGFRAFGDHLPKAPAVPEAIQRSLETNAANEKYTTNSDTGRYNNYDGAAARYSGYTRALQRTPFNFNRNFDASVAASGNAQEFDDLNGVEVGTAEVDVNRQYLAPNVKHTEGGYRY